MYRSRSSANLGVGALVLGLYPEWDRSYQVCHAKSDHVRCLANVGRLAALRLSYVVRYARILPTGEYLCIWKRRCKLTCADSTLRAQLFQNPLQAEVGYLVFHRRDTSRLLVIRTIRSELAVLVEWRGFAEMGCHCRDCNLLYWRLGSIHGYPHP